MSGPAVTVGLQHGHFRLETLGAASLSDDRREHRSGETVLSGKALALLVYLTCINGRASREHLSDLLWADLEPDSARHALRQTIWYLRKRLGDDLIVATGSDIGLGRPVASDRETFLTAINQQDLEAAVTAYTGDFLPNFAVAGGGAFEQWADLERRQLRTAFLRSADKLTRRHLATGRFSEAVALARRIRDTDRDAESGWRLLIEALVASRDTLAATIEADALEAMLRDEGREPEPATRAALRIARQAPDASADLAPRRALVADTVGREREFAMLLGAWDDARLGRGRHVHVTAPAGLGKTRLLGDVHTRIVASRARAVALRANPGDRSIPYAVAAELAVLLAPLPGARAISPASAAALLAISPALSSWFTGAPDTASGDDALRRRTVAMAELVAAIASEQPLAIAIDDLHWADTASRQLIAGLAGRLDTQRVLLLTAARPIADHGGEGARSEVLALRPLTVTDLHELLTRIASLPDATWADRLAADLAAATGGSPLLAVETLHLLLERDVLRLDADGWTLHDEPRLGDLLGAESAIVRRLEQLSRPESWQLVLLASAGAPLPTATLGALTGVSAAEADETLQMLERRGLIAQVDGQWLPAHDEIADRMLAVASADAVRAAHLALGRHYAASRPARADALGRAIRHFVVTGEHEGRDAAFRAAWMLVRHADRSATPRTVAHDMLGEFATPERVATLVDAIPLLERPWFARAARAAAATVVLMAGATAAVAALRPPDVAPDAVLEIVQRVSPDRVNVRRLAVTPRLFTSGGAIRLSDLPSEMRASLATINGEPAVSPDGRWAVYPKTFDEGVGQGIDLVLRDSRNVDRRITFAPGDDDGATFHPSSQYIFFSSAEADREFEGARIKAFEIATGRMRELTHGRPRSEGIAWTDLGPVPSPDGGRIAFYRRPRTADAESLCVVMFDGSEERCTELPFGVSTGNVFWVTPTRVVANSDSLGSHVLWELDVPSRSVRRLGSVDGVTVPSGGLQYLASLSDSGVIIQPAEHPENARQVALGNSVGRFSIRWVPIGAPTLVSTVRIEGPSSAPVAGGSYLLRAVTLGVDGHPVTTAGVRWRVVSGAADVTADGVLHAARPGPVRISADLGGWRADTLALNVERAHMEVAMSESWKAWPTPRWAPFGSPRPYPWTGPDGVASVALNGGRSFGSGVYSREEIDALSGVGVEASFSTPITRVLWQTLNAALIGVPDTAALARWDHGNGGMPVVWYCAFNMPNGEHPSGFDRVSLSAQGRQRSRPWSLELHSGRWHRVALQLFPDGRCGLAIDGLPVLLHGAATVIPRKMRVLFSSYSVDTRIRVGPLTVWRGINTAIDWRALEREDSTNAALVRATAKR